MNNRLKNRLQDKNGSLPSLPTLPNIGGKVPHKMLWSFSERLYLYSSPALLQCLMLIGQKEQDKQRYYTKITLKY